MNRTLLRRETDRRIWALALPALGALAADPLLSLVDTYFVSRLGVIGLGALAVNTAIFGFAFVVFNFLAYVTTPLVARALGAGQKEEANSTVSTALGLGFLLGILAAVVLVVGARFFLDLVRTGPEVMEPALAYLRIRALAAPAVLVTLAAHGAFRGLSDTRTPLLVALVVNIINAALCPLLIFSFDLGVPGAAIASASAQYLGAVLLLTMLKRRMGGITRFQWRKVGALLRPGGLITVRTFFLVFTLAWATSIASDVGNVALAGHQVVRETWFLSSMLIDGLAIAAMALIADAIGSGDHERQLLLKRRLFLWGTVAGVVFALAWLVGGNTLAAIFAPTREVADQIVSVMPIVALFALPAAWLWVADGVVLGQFGLARMAVSSGAGLVAAGTVLTLTRERGWGLAGVWWAIGAMLITRLLVLVPTAVPFPGFGKKQGEDGSEQDSGTQDLHSPGQS